MEDIYGKITTSATKQDGSAVTENLGYTKVNPFNAGSASHIAAIKQLGMAVTGLTTNFYKKTNITYEVNLDTWTED